MSSNEEFLKIFTIVSGVYIGVITIIKIISLFLIFIIMLIIFIVILIRTTKKLFRIVIIVISRNRSQMIVEDCLADFSA